MAKRSRRPVTPRPTTQPSASTTPAQTPDELNDDDTPVVATSAVPPRTRARGTRSSNRARRTALAEPTFFERNRTLLLGGAAVTAVLVVGYFVFFANKAPTTYAATGPKYACDTLLTPGPQETLPTPPPSFVDTPTPLATPSAVPSASAATSAAPSAATSAAPSVAASGAASGSPSTSAAPSGSAPPAESGAPSATPSPTAAASSEASPSAAPATPTPQPTLRLGFATEILGRNHITNAGQTIEYGFCPPDSGDHYNIPNVGPIKAAVYPPSAEQPPGGWVHNLEHGWVVMLYRCPGGQPGQQGCPTTDQLNLMQQLYDQAPTPDPSQGCSKEMIVARFDGMTTQFAELAWGRELLTNDFSLDRALTFAQQWTDAGSEPEKTIC